MTTRHWRLSADYIRGRVFIGLVAVVLAGVTIAVGVAMAKPAVHGITDAPPPPGGYFRLRPVGAYASLPDDRRAAAEVHLSSWEPRPGNNKYNGTRAGHFWLKREKDSDRADDPRWNKYVLGRITGHFTGTTDEIFQWAAAKWGLPDNLLRTIAYMESDWHQSNFGDYVYDAAQCPPGYNKLPCPVTFGIVGTKSTSWRGIFPWNRNSTAAAVDVLGGWLRGCYEGWVWWLRDHGSTSGGSYHSGDIWGCVGAWYSGRWHDGPADGHGGESYLLRAQDWDKLRPWLRRGF